MSQMKITVKYNNGKEYVVESPAGDVEGMMRAIKKLDELNTQPQNEQKVEEKLCDRCKSLQELFERSKKNNPFKTMKEDYVLLPNITQYKVNECEHDYPFPWHSVLPPYCNKCGERAPQTTITCCERDEYIQIDGELFEQKIL